MSKNCAICNEKIEEDYGKVKGTMLRVRDENKKNQLIYVCSVCQKHEGWIEKAKVNAA